MQGWASLARSGLPFAPCRHRAQKLALKSELAACSDPALVRLSNTLGSRPALISLLNTFCSELAHIGLKPGQAARLNVPHIEFKPENIWCLHWAPARTHWAPSVLRQHTFGACIGLHRFKPLHRLGSSEQGSACIGLKPGQAAHRCWLSLTLGSAPVQAALASHRSLATGLGFT